MRYMMMVKCTADYEAGIRPSEKLMTDMGKFMQETARAGILISAEGLQPTSKGSRLHYSGGKFTVTDGPFAEAKELIGGYAIVEAKSHVHAIELARQFVDVHINAGIDEVDVEIRPLWDGTSAL
jgi:hypothetical protein